MTQANETTSRTHFLKSFPRTFWTANLMEMFERGAYYGMNAVLALYLTSEVSSGALGLSKDKAGFLQGIIYAMTYVIPIIGGALADRLGYRRMLLVAFSLLTGGYWLTMTADAYWKIFLTLTLVAAGAGLFKPIISGTIARTTTEATSGFGFGLYYWMINVGALIAPLIVVSLRSMGWKYVFLFSGACTGLMFLPTLFLYDEPPRPENTKSFRDVAAGALTVLSDSRFMLMVFIYSLFWVLYFQNFGTVLWYLMEFVDRTPVDRFFATLGLDVKFTEAHVTSINAGTIVVLQVIISLVTRKLKPLPSMMSGIVIGAMGFFILAFSSSAWMFVLGIVVFSIGEMTCHPKYYSFVGQVAPAENKAVYMGYAFLYGVIGSLIGSSAGGALYEYYLTPFRGAPTAAVDQVRSFWMAFGILGFLAMSGLLLYTRVFGQDTAHTRRLARRVMFVVYTLFILGGAAFMSIKFTSGRMEPKDIVQSCILIAIGVLGNAVSLRNGRLSAEA